MKVVTVEEMRAIEAAADAGGHSYSAMMENAGRAVTDALVERIDVKGKRVLVLVGPGNNGGDGLVAAYYLRQAGAEVVCYLTRSRTPDEDENFRRLQEHQVRCASAGDANKRALARMVAGADVIMDALLGTGTVPPVRGAIGQVLKAVAAALDHRARAGVPKLTHMRGPAPSASRPLIVAVDGPSGLQFDTGELDELALSADLTVTFAYPKRGHFRFPGAAASGDLVVADIGTDPALAAGVCLEVATPAMVRNWLPARPPNAHKGTFGRAMIVAGSMNYTGAAQLAGAASVRSGTGLTTLALPSSIHAPVAAGLPEATYLLLPDVLGAVDERAVAVLAQALRQYDAVLLGPGLGLARETRAFVEKLFAGPGHRAVGFHRPGADASQQQTIPPLVVDADGLNILSEMEGWAESLPPGAILTPHPGEMARLIDCSIAEVEADRIGVARRQAESWGHVVVLKGAFTVVAAPDGRVVLEPFANPGLATGGTGDVLAGIIVALRAQGADAFEAATAGAYLHGLAGDIACQALGAAGMTAGDVITALPQAWQKME
jgi:NAD(P)H-hydrate epimerase